MTISKKWRESVSKFADLPFLALLDAQVWTYAQVDERVRALQAFFAARGCSKGDKIALWAGNVPEWGVAYLAVSTAAMTICPILPDFIPKDVAGVLRHAGARFLVLGTTQRAAWDAWLAEAEAADREFAAGLELLDLERTIAAPDLATAKMVPAFPEPEAGDMAALIYTSGTTGNSKGVMLSHRNLMSNVTSSAPLSLMRRGDSMLSVLPLAHTYECTLGFLVPMSLGANVWYTGKPPAPAVLLPALAKVRPHCMLTVPLLMEKIYRSKIAPGLEQGLVGKLARLPVVGTLLRRIAGKKLMKTFGGRLRFFGIGGAALAPEVAEFLQRSGFPYAIGYGLTETSPLIAGRRGGALFSTGPVLEGVELRIAEPLNEQGAGEIQVRGPNVMLGYYRDEAKTREAFTADGWFRTGDLGCMGAKGQLFIKGRSKNLILGPSGENIYPEAIEALLNQDSLVLESLVLQRGKEIVAKVVLNAELLQERLGDWAKARRKDVVDLGHDTREQVAAYAEQLKRQINSHLARFSHITALEIQDTPFEKTATLKIKRYLYN